MAQNKNKKCDKTKMISCIGYLWQQLLPEKIRILTNKSIEVAIKIKNEGTVPGTSPLRKPGSEMPENPAPVRMLAEAVIMILAATLLLCCCVNAVAQTDTSAPAPAITMLEKSADGRVILSADGFRNTKLTWQLVTKDKITRLVLIKYVRTGSICIFHLNDKEILNVCVCGRPLAGKGKFCTARQSFPTADGTPDQDTSGHSSINLMNSPDFEIYSKVILSAKADKLPLNGTETDILGRFYNLKANLGILQKLTSCSGFRLDPNTEFLLQQSLLDTVNFPPTIWCNKYGICRITAGNAAWDITFHRSRNGKLTHPFLQYKEGRHALSGQNNTRALKEEVDGKKNESKNDR